MQARTENGEAVALDPPSPDQRRRLRYRVVRLNRRQAGGVLNASGQVAYSELDDNGGFVPKFYDGRTTVPIAPGRTAFVTDLSDSGQVSGVLTVGAGRPFHAFRWSRAGGLVELEEPPGVEESYTSAINNRGQVAGYKVIDDPSGQQALFWDPRTGVRPLVTPGGPSPIALGINNAGQVILNGLTANGVGAAFVWSQRRDMVALVPPGALGSDARVINDSGQVAGNFSTPESSLQMFLWTPGAGFTGVGDQPGGPFALSDNGVVAGVLLSQRAFVWSRQLGLVDIGFLPGGSFSNAYGVNNRAQVVGDATVADGSMHAFLWTPDEGLSDLNDRLLDRPPAVLRAARHINNDGVILAATEAGLVLLFPRRGDRPAQDAGGDDESATPD